MTAVSHNIKFLSDTDQGGRGDGVQVMVNRDFAYIRYGFSNGIGHDRRFHATRATSAMPPITTMKADVSLPICASFCPTHPQQKQQAISPSERPEVAVTDLPVGASATSETCYSLLAMQSYWS